MKLKKLLTGAFVVLSTLAILGACGSKDKEAGKNKGKTTITYAIWDDSQATGMRAIADGFMKENPDITVKVESTPWDQYWTKLEAGANGSNMPDVFWMHGNEAQRYMENDVLMDLTDKFDTSKFPEELTEIYSNDGKNYGIAKDLTSVGLFYNKKIFDDAGVAYPDDTWDWKKLTEVAKELTDEGKGIYGFGAPNSNEAGYYSYIFSNGGSILSEDGKASTIASPETQEVLQWWSDFSLKDKSSPTSAQLSENSLESYFISGRVAMGTFGSWQVANFMENDFVKENCDVTFLPKIKERVTVYNGLANSASANTKNKEATLSFMKYLGEKEANEIQSKSGAAMSAYEGTSQAWADGTKGLFNTQVFVDMLENKKIRPNGNNFQKAESYQTEQLAKIFDGQVSTKELTEKIQPEITKILNE